MVSRSPRIQLRLHALTLASLSPWCHPSENTQIYCSISHVMNPPIQNPQLINCTAGSTAKLNNLAGPHSRCLEAQPIHLIQTKYLQYIERKAKRLPAETVCWVFHLEFLIGSLWRCVFVLLLLDVVQEHKSSCMWALLWFGELPPSRALWCPAQHPAVTAFIMELLTLSDADRKWGKALPCRTVQHNVGSVTAASHFTVRGLKQKQVMNQTLCVD